MLYDVALQLLKEKLKRRWLRRTYDVSGHRPKVFLEMKIFRQAKTKYYVAKQKNFAREKIFMIDNARYFQILYATMKKNEEKMKKK